MSYVWMICSTIWPPLFALSRHQGECSELQKYLPSISPGAPASPLSSIPFTRSIASPKRDMKPTCVFTRARSVAVTIRSAVSMSSAMGFSMKTWTPRAAACSTSSLWANGGRQT